MVNNLGKVFEERLNEAIKILKQEYDPIVIYLFGSASRNELREDSDIDIAFLSEKQIDSYECFIKAQELADIFKSEVDLVDLNMASTVFKVQVIGKGQRIYCSDETKRMFFEMRAFKAYAMLNEEREEILNKIRERGSVYGE